MKKKEYTILKHPYFGSSQTLIESFLIIGYDTNDVLLSILKEKPELIYKRSYYLQNEVIFEYKNKVSIISEITSEKCNSIPNYDDIIDKCFPYGSGKIYLNKKEIEYPYSFQFYLRTSKHIDTYNFGFVYKFYEYFLIEDKTTVCIPKVFCILSQYPYFNYFRIVASEIYKGFNEYCYIVLFQ